MTTNKLTSAELLARLLKKRTLSEIAERTGISKSILSRIVNHGVGVGEGHWRALAKEYERTKGKR